MDLGIKELPDTKTQLSLERALGHKEIFKAYVLIWKLSGKK